MKIRPSATGQTPEKPPLQGPRSALRLKPLAAHIRRALFPGLVLGLQVGTAIAGPEGGNVVGGSGSIARPDANTTVINQQSHNLAIDWQKFNVKSHELVQFNQPGRNAQALNRIFDQSASQIHGRINANGRVLLMNPNGVIFGRTSQVNVNGLVAAGMKNIPVDDFMAGKFKLEALEGADGAVVNQGTLQAASGGDITLVGKSIRNEGVILASAGRVNLAAGNKVTLDFDGDGLIRFAVDEKVLENAQALDDQIANTGEIAARGGDVIIAASAAQDVFTNAINNTGIVRAGRVENTGGTVRLVGMGPSSSVLNTGTIDVSAADTVSSGGYVDITGATIRQGGAITADAVVGDGGSVRIESTQTTALVGDAVVSAKSTAGGEGGRVALLGDRVGILDAASVDVSGTSGGGEALIGGGFQGKEPEVRNATVTVVDADTTVKADATESGDGGTVIVWADEATWFHGDISAQGGPNGGDGGFVETSGKAYLDMRGSVSAAAPQGEAGTWLLDPTDITVERIATTAGDDSEGGAAVGGLFDVSGAPHTFTATTEPARADIDQIEASLMGGTNVEVITNIAGGTGQGDITVQDAITVTGTGGSLTLDAYRNITLNAGIDGSAATTFDLILNFGQTVGGILDFGSATILADSLTITGGAGVDTIIGPDAVNMWTSTANIGGDLASANFTGFVNATFTLVENLTGGSAADTMNIGHNFTNIDGGLGADIINITAGALTSVTGNAGGDTITIDADPGVNVLGGADGDIININVSLANAVMGEGGNDTFNIGAAAVVVTLGVDGGSESDTVVGPNAVNIWNITAADAANLTGGSTFTSVEALTGGAMADTFNVATTIDWAGALNGGAGDDLFNFADGATAATIDGGVSATGDTIDWSLETGALTVAATGLTAPAATGEGFDGTATGAGATAFSGIEILIGNDVATSSLQGPALTNTWTVNNANDGNVLADDSTNPTRTLTFTNFPDLIGGSGADTFQISGTGTITSVAGGGGTDTLVGGASNNIWNITSPGGGSVFDNDNTNFDVTQFTAISTLRGNTMDDAFRFTSGTSATTVDGGQTGASGDILDFNTGNFDAAITATLTAESATDGLSGSVTGIITNFSNINDITGDVDFASTNALVGNIGTGGAFDLTTGVYTSTAGSEPLDFTNFTSFTGGAGEDAFIFADATSTIAIAGGSGGTDTLDLSADATDLMFTINGGDDGSVGSIAFTNVGNITSGSGDDTFTLTSTGSVSGTLDAGAMNATGDVLDFNTNNFDAVVAVTFSAESATDGLSGSVNTNDVSGFANMNSVIGDADFSNSLIGDIATGGTFDLTANTYTSTNGPVTVDFSADFVSFTGGGGEDAFIFTDATTAYAIDGGSAGTDTLDLSADGTSLTFTIDGVDDGSVGMITFTDVGNLISGAGDDVFNLDNNGGATSGSLSGTITANGGTANAISWAAVTSAVSVTLSAESGTGFAGSATGSASVGGFTDIHDITGTAQTDTLTGTNAGGTFLIDDQNAWQDYTETNTLTFTGFEDLTGGTGIDTFNFQTDGSSTAGTVIHTGTIDGGDGGDAYFFTNDAELNGTITDTGATGTDVIDVSLTLMDVFDNPDAGVIVSRIDLRASGVGETDSINNGGEPASITSGAGRDDFSGIDDVDAPVLFADPAGSVFEITADGTVIRDGEPAETGILQIVGATDAADVFIFDDIALLAGIGGIGIIGGDITGGTEFEDRIELRNMSTNITVAQFDINGIDSGSITIDAKTTTFVGVESLLGLDGIGDLFNFTGSGFIRGQIDGRGGSDTADYSAVTNGSAFTIALDETITPALLSDTQSGVVSVETLTGHATNPELFTIAGGSSFTLTAAQTDAGMVTGGGGTTAAFTNWGNLTGTSGADSFTFNAGSAISGAINGLAGADTIDIDLIAGAQTITLTNASPDNGTTIGGYDGTIGTLMTGFSNVTVLVGTGNGDELIGDDVAATWTIDGGGTETYATNAGGDPDFTFSNITDLTGGTAADTFDLDVDVAGTVAGGAGNDAFNINASLATAVLQGGDDSDTFSLADSVVVTNVIDGGSGGSNIDELEGAATLATTFNVTGNGVGNVANGATASYTGVENLTGRGGADTFNVTGSHTGDLSGGAANDDFNFDSNTLTGNVNGDGGDDTFDFNGGDVVGTLAGGGNTGTGDTLDFAGVGGPVSIDLGDSGTDMGVTVGTTTGFTGDGGNDFTGIENYIGTAAADTLLGTVDPDVFNVTADNLGNINAGAATFSSFELLMGEGGNDQFNISNTVTVGDVTGGLGSDLLNLSAFGTDLTFTLNAADGTGSVAAPSITFSGIENYSSGSGNDTYTVSHAMAIDLGTAPLVASSIDGGGHTTFDQVNFTSGADTVVAIANIPGIERISSTGASDTLVGQAAGETFQTTSLDDGTVGTLSYTNFENLDGAGGNDIFRIDHNITGTVQGGNNSDSFFIINTAAVSVGGLDGGAGNDTFQIGQNFSDGAPGDVGDVTVTLTAPMISGGTGADVFDFREGSTLVGSVDGTDGNAGGATDRITMAFSTLGQEVLTAPGTVPGSLSGTIKDFPALPVLPDLISGTFDNIVTIIGNNLGTLVGPNQANDWQITGVDTGTLNGSGFTNFSLLGGTLVDTFTFQAGGRITGGVRGGSDAVADVVVSAVAGTHFHIDTNNDGRIVLDPPLGGATLVTSFFDIGTLQGSAGGTETFFVDVAWSGRLDGGAGGAIIDFVNGPAASLGTQNLVLTGVGSGPIGVSGSTTNVPDFDNITTIINAGPGSVTAPNFATAFTINAGGTSTVAINDTVNIGTVTVTQLGNLIGGSEADTFTVNTNYTGNLTGNGGDDNFVLVTGSVSGTADGGAGIDTLDYTTGTYGALNVVISGAGGTDGFMGFEVGAFSLSGFNNINTILGRGGADNLTAPNTPNTWTITGTSAFTLNGVTFNGFTNATGGSSSDAFTVADGGFTFGGTVNGAGGANSLTGRTTANTWNLSSANGGSVNGVTAFANVQTLFGGSGTDDFQFADTVGAGYTAIDGGGNVDTLNYSGYTLAPISVNLATGAASFVTNASAVEIITGTGMVDAVTGPNSVNTWDFAASGQGTINGGSGGGGFDFNGIENLTGGTLADTFNVDVDHTGDLAGAAGADIFNIFTNGTVLTGNVRGDADSDQIVFSNDAFIMGTVDGGSGIDVLDWQNSTLVINFTSNGPGTVDGFRGDLPATITVIGDGFNNINAFAGSGLGSTFTGSNLPSVYTINGVDSFTVSENGGVATPFVGFGTIVGGTSIDQFIFSGGTLSGTIDGGSQLTFENILVADNSATNTWTLGVSGAGSVDPVPGGFININQLVGGAGVNDTFNFTNAAATFTSIDGGAGAGVNDLNYSGIPGPITLNLQTSTATLVTAFSNVNSVTGSAAADTLVAEDNANAWNVTASESGTVDGFAFSEIENLVGGAATDTFTINAANLVTGNIAGGGDNDLIVQPFNSSWLITGVNAGTTDGVGGTFSGVENLTAAGSSANLDMDGGSITGNYTASTVTLNADGTSTTSGADINIIGNLSAATNQTITTGGGAFSVSGTLTGTGAGFNINTGGGTATVNGATNASSFTVNSGGSNVGAVTTTGSQSYGGPTTFRGDLTGSNLTFNGPTTFNGDHLLQSTTNVWDFNAAVSGTGNLDIIPTANTDIFIGNGNGPGNIASNQFGGFQGHLIVGAQLDPLDSPAEEAVVVMPPGVTADLITVEENFLVGGDVTLIGSNIMLDSGVSGGAGTGQVTLIAVGDSQSNGGEGPGDITGPASGTAVIGGGKAVLIANNGIVNAGNIRLDLNAGELLLAVSASQDEPTFDASSSATSVSFDPTTIAIIASLGLNLQSVQVVFSNPASALTGLQNVQFIDVGLFEEELSLFGVIGNGIALSLDQCEEAEGCAPNVSEEEIDALIAQIEGRIAEIERRLASGEIDSSEGQRLLAGFQQELQNYQTYKEQLAAFNESQLEFGDDFGELDDFAEEFDDAEPVDVVAPTDTTEIETPQIAAPAPGPEAEPIEEAFEELEDEFIEQEIPVDEFEDLEEDLEEDSPASDDLLEDVPDEFEDLDEEFDEFEELGKEIDPALLLRLTHNANVNEYRGALGIGMDGRVVWTGDIILPSYARQY